MRPFVWKTDSPVLLMAMLAPSVLTWLYFVVYAGQGETTRNLYLISKVVLGLLPIGWFLWMQSGSSIESAPPPRRHGLSFVEGLAFGLLTFGGMLFLYYFFLRGQPALAGTTEALLAKLQDAGV